MASISFTFKIPFSKLISLYSILMSYSVHRCLPNVSNLCSFLRGKIFSMALKVKSKDPSQINTRKLTSWLIKMSFNYRLLLVKKSFNIITKRKTKIFKSSYTLQPLRINPWIPGTEMLLYRNEATYPSWKRPVLTCLCAFVSVVPLPWNIIPLTIVIKILRILQCLL